MRKTSRSRPLHFGGGTLDTDLCSTRPLRIPGATITSWSGSPGIDLDCLFAVPLAGVSVGGADSVVTATDKPPAADRRTGETVSLSDGTRITFAATG
jgi:hypothetical protein